MPTIAADELSRQLRQNPEDVFLLDVRDEDAFEEWHIDGSHNIPVYTDLMEKNYDAVRDKIDELPHDKEIVTICGAGVSSDMMTELLHEQGYDNVKTLEDGLRGWARVYQDYTLRDTGDRLDIQFVRPGTGCLSYLIADTASGKAAVVDPGQHIGTYQEAAAERELTIVAVLDTHVHADHISGGPALADAEDVPYYTGDTVDAAPYQAVDDGDTVTVGNRTLEVLHVPGHTSDSVVYKIDDAAVLTGDTLFIEGVGRPDLGPGTDIAPAARQLFSSLQRLKELPSDVEVWPAHFGKEDRRPVTGRIGGLTAENAVFGIDDEEEFVAAMQEQTPDTPPSNYTRIKAVNAGEEAVSDEEATEMELGPNRCASG